MTNAKTVARKKAASQRLAIDKRLVACRSGRRSRCRRGAFFVSRQPNKHRQSNLSCVKACSAQVDLDSFQRLACSGNRRTLCWC